MKKKTLLSKKEKPGMILLNKQLQVIVYFLSISNMSRGSAPQWLTNGLYLYV